MLDAYTGEIITATAILAVQAVYGFAGPRVAVWLESRRHRRRAAALARAVAAGVPAAVISRHPVIDDWAESEPPRRARVRPAPGIAPAASPGATRSPPLRLAGPVPVQPPVAPAVACDEGRAAPVQTERMAVLRVPLKPHLEMRAIDHVREFLSEVRANQMGKSPKTGRWECRRDSAQWLKVYHAWAESRALKTIPEWQFLGLLSEQAGVEKTRDRLKDAQGRVIKTATGSPVRSYFYTVFEVAVPVCEPARRRRAA